VRSLVVDMVGVVGVCVCGVVCLVRVVGVEGVECVCVACEEGEWGVGCRVGGAGGVGGLGSVGEKNFTTSWLLSKLRISGRSEFCFKIYVEREICVKEGVRVWVGRMRAGG
jgi:hypothetical protein